LTWNGVRVAHVFEVEVIAADRRLFTGQATSLVIPGVDGYFGVLYGHAPLVGALGVGELLVTGEDGKPTRIALHGGFVEVTSEHTVILADAAELADAIDVERARLAAQRAQERLKQKAPDIDFERARASLMRAINRMKVGSGGGNGNA
jgi:F-type H+-transporting ATPase subunit epsilon